MRDNSEIEQTDEVRLYRQLPGISEILARRISTQLGVHTLEELELAAHDGRLKKVRGFGTQRIRTVKEILASGWLKAIGTDREKR
jgi:hypothetical protein